MKRCFTIIKKEELPPVYLGRWTAFPLPVSVEVSGEAKNTWPCVDGNAYFSAKEEAGGKKVEEGARLPGALMALRFPARRRQGLRSHAQYGGGGGTQRSVSVVGKRGTSAFYRFGMKNAFN